MGKKLLLADDSVTIQKVVGISFASEDVELVTVDNGNDAVTRAREIRPDVVLADVVMPGLNGYEVCEALQADPDLRHVPVLLLTGNFESFDEERAARCGAAGHVAKPFEAQALVDRVRALLARPPEPSPADSLAAATGETGEPTPTGADAFDFFEDGMVDVEPAATVGIDLDPDASAFAFGDDPLAGVSQAQPTPDQTLAGMPEEARRAFAVTQLDADLAAGDTGENTADDLAQETILDPKGASGYDVSSSDLGDPLAVPPAEALGISGNEPLFAIGVEEPVATAADESAFEDLTPAAPEPGPLAVEGLDFDSFAPAAEPIAVTELIAEHEPTQFTATHDVSALAGAALAAVEPRLRESLHDTLEKIAWESLGNLSEQIVRQAVERVEQIAWEVIPQLAETLIHEEIRRMKGGERD